jgi:hypothetical protein
MKQKTVLQLKILLRPMMTLAMSGNSLIKSAAKEVVSYRRALWIPFVMGITVI